jgi:hypothetical protein
MAGETIILSQPGRFMGTVAEVMWYLDGRADVILEPLGPGSDAGPRTVAQLLEWGFTDQTADYRAQGG